MSLETLLEAAEFLESRGKELESKRAKSSHERRRSTVSEEGISKDWTDSNDTDEAVFKEPREKVNHGKMSPLVSGRSGADGFVMRAGTREVHNKLEKNRRAHLKECFDFLKKNIPSLEDKRTSNLGILRSSLRYIQNLKRREREFEVEMQNVAREKIDLTLKVQSLKRELNTMDIEVDLSAWTSADEQDNETNSTSTATERGTPPPSDHDEHDDDEEEAENLVMETNPSPTPKLKHRKGSKEISSQKHHKLPSGSNGLVPRPYLSTALKAPPKKTIPITLSLTGPITQAPAVPMVGPKPAPINSSLGKPLEIPMSRLPVTQILHRTLTQRQALMKQSTISQVSIAPLTAAQLKTPPLTSRPSAAVTDGIKSLPSGVTQIVPTTSLQLLSSSVTSAHTTKSSLPGNVPMINSVQTISGVTQPPTLPLTVPYYMASMQKISHPILVTSLMAPAIGLTTSAAPVSSTPSASNIKLATSVIPLKTLSNLNIKSENVPMTMVSTTTSTVNYITAPIISPATTNTTSTVSVSNSFPIRPIFAPNLFAGQVAWPFLTIPRTSILPTTSASTSQIPTSLQTNSPQTTTVPVMSLTQLNQLTQMMTPVTVMSPSLQVTPNQLNTMIASPLLKQFQLPLGIPTSLLQPGQVLGQQVMKPVVVVTVPSIVSQASALPATVTSVTAVTTSA